MNILPESPYFDIEVNVWEHAYHSQGPYTTTLGEFLSGEFFNKIQWRFDFPRYIWVFKPNKDNEIKIDPKYLNACKNLIDNCTLPDAVTRLQSYVQQNGKDEFVASVKQLYPSITISATFNEFRRLVNINKITKLVALDIDGVDDVHKTMQVLDALNICLWISKSITGTGVFCIIPIECPLDQESEIKEHYAALNLLMIEKGIKLDVLKDATRLRFWADPTDAIINVNVTPFKEKYIEPEDVQMYSRETSLVSLGPTSAFDTDKYWEACHKKGLKNASDNLKLPLNEFTELHTFIKYYHWAFNHYGLSVQYVIDKCWLNFFKDHPSILKNNRYTYDRVCKDFKNFYKNYKKQHHTFDFAIQKSNSLKQRSVVYDKEIVIRYGRKLKDLASQIPLLNEKHSYGLFEDNRDHINRVILDAPTGVGKTTTTIQYCLDNNIKTIIVAPTQGAIEQIKAIFPTVTLFYQISKSAAYDDLIIATTYSSFEKLHKTFRIEERFLILDEFHNAVLSTSKGFRNKEINYIMDKLIHFEKTLLMTGTNLTCHHPIIDSFYKVKVKYEDDITKTLQIIYYSSNRYNVLISKLKKSSDLQIIYLDNKNLRKTLGTLIDQLHLAGYSDNEIQIINADQKLSDMYKELIMTGYVKPGCRIVITTKIFVEALNLYDRVKAFHILSPIHGAHMQQLVTRPRLNLSTEIYMYWSEKLLNEQDDTFWFDQEMFYNNEIISASKYLSTFDNSEWDDIHRKNFRGDDLLRRKQVPFLKDNQGLYFDEMTSEYRYELCIDYLNIDYNTQYVQMLSYKKNPEQLYEFLKQYNWTIKTPLIGLENDDVIDPSINAEKNKEFGEEVTSFIDILIEQGNLQNQSVLSNKVYEKVNWKIELRKRYSKLCQLFDIRYANELIKHVGINNSAYLILMQRVKIRQALLYGKKSDVYDFANLIFAIFPIGKVFTSSQILQELLNIVQSLFEKVHETNRLNSLNNATKILSQYVEIERCKVVDPNGVPLKGRKIAYKNAYKIVSHHPIRSINGTAIEPLEVVK